MQKLAPYLTGNFYCFCNKSDIKSITLVYISNIYMSDYFLGFLLSSSIK